MKILLNVFKFLKNVLVKNRELVLFFIASVLIALLYPEGRRFPHDWKKNSTWKYDDLIAEFSFVRPLSDDELFGQQDSIHQKIVYFQLIQLRPQIELHFSDSSVKNFIGDEISDQIIKAFEVKLIANEKINEISNEKNSCFILKESDTLAIDCKNILLASHVQRELKKSLDSAFLYKGFSPQDVSIIVLPNLKLFKQENLTELNFLHVSKSELIQQGDVLVKKGQIIDQKTHYRLRFYRDIYKTGYPFGLNRFYSFLGKWILVSIILFMLYQFLVFFRPNVFEDSSKILMILSFVLIFFFVSTQMAKRNEEWIYFVPMPIVPIVLKAFYDTRLALFTHFLLLLLIGIYISDVYTFFLLHFTSGVFSIITVESIYKRSQLFTSVFKIIAVYLFVFFSLQLTTGQSFASSTDTYLKLTINSFLILLAFPIIYGIERIFGMVSDLSLLELSDTNMPLLKELAEKAPGTFQHSIQVSSLAESAAAVIGANTLLVRTAALYHDIGKMKHPQFFIENQVSGYNPHDELSFEESARVIIEHVKEGITLARERKLPESIIDFIRTHHGTTAVQYFYKMYLKNFPEDPKVEERFRYQGPTPFSKETAILMLADSVEAACRSLAQMGADRFQMEAQIDVIFESLMEQRQFDNANITLAEISEVKKTLKKKIINIYHSRITYPK
ncbi:HDIG domain-containing protein [Thermaurantimonas aggregans]|uniref:HDIG domain-containing protein n=1 Tax=Thermaurantimonas aggregans TaxID=2173829 RepID=A0A401XHV1_9FLAO|nr:HDIG domain-containing metalloprotein [Thermaurantimonas aggregans]MCX8149435.1 HDIG domain-containing protein [Thermaurantimonas aggregans]GCD76578.1 HDIG domain-containing protein [Thermaurantimonas aggregans]